MAQVAQAPSSAASAGSRSGDETESMTGEITSDDDKSAASDSYGDDKSGRKEAKKPRPLGAAHHVPPWLRPDGNHDNCGELAINHALRLEDKDVVTADELRVVRAAAAAAVSLRRHVSDAACCAQAAEEIRDEAKAKFVGSKRKFGARVMTVRGSGKKGRPGCFSYGVIARALRRRGLAMREVRWDFNDKQAKWLHDGRSYFVALKPYPKPPFRIHCIALTQGELIDGLNWPEKNPVCRKGAHLLNDRLRDWLLRHANHVWRVKPSRRRLVRTSAPPRRRRRRRSPQPPPLCACCPRAEEEEEPAAARRPRPPAVREAPAAAPAAAVAAACPCHRLPSP
jgi:hypothetical protein